MKSLNLNAYGVSEMSLNETRNVDGGNPLLWLLIGIVVAELLDRDAASDFAEGYNAAKP